ncbi:MAG: glycosyltransferase [Chromatiaceae bacterium]|nr:glycosyltransferase [Chromatiaceae bacterium]
MLHRALPELAERLTISFSRQYPALIFPGESDRDPSHEGHWEIGVEYLIDSLNPLSWRKAVNRVLAYDADIVVLPWWSVYWVVCFRYLARALRRRGLTVVFFCHNVIEHESAGWKTALTRSVLRHGCRFVVHTKEDAAQLRRLIPGASVSVHAHPIYDQFPEPKHELPKRGSLELLFYGFVRPYKGLDVLVEAMARTSEGTQLTIAGEFWADEERIRSRIRDLGLSDRIELRSRYQTDQETAELFARSDVVILPYRSATGSGVVPVAYHYDKPVIATRVGGLPEVVDDGKTGILIPADSVDALAEAINGLTRDDAAGMVPAIRAMKHGMTWTSLASTLLDAPKVSACSPVY